MWSMSGNGFRDEANRQTESVAATTLIGLLLAFLALPLCSAAFTCTMPCCEHSSAPMAEHRATPGPACGTECSVRAAVPASVEVLVYPQWPDVLPLQASRMLSDVIACPSPEDRRLPCPRSRDRHLYVINDAFLI